MGRAHTRLNSRHWRRVRWAVIRRDKFTCRACGKVGGRIEVDHVTPLAKVDPGDPTAPYRLDNLQVLCRACHFAKTQREIGRGPGPQGRREIAGWERYCTNLAKPETVP